MKWMTTNRGWLAALAASLLVAVVGWLAITAATEAAANTVAIDPASATVAPGGDVTVNVTAEAPAGKKIGGWVLTITYDAAVLSVADCTGQSNCNPAVAGTVGLSGLSANGLSGSQVLAEITFTAIGDAGDSSDVTITVTDFNDSDVEPTDPSTADGLITIAAPTASPTAAPTAAPTASPSPTPVLPKTGGAPSGDDSSGLVPWALAGLGLVVIGGGVWAVARMRRETH